MVKKGVLEVVLVSLAIFAIVLAIVPQEGYSWTCKCSNPGANGGCGGGCTFSGVTCGPGEIQWCSPYGPCKPLVQAPSCYSRCPELLKTGGMCVCGNYVWPITTTTVPHPTTTTCPVCTTSTTTTSLFCGGANLTIDDNNCGFCGNICPDGFHCEGGFCVGEIGPVTTTAWCGGLTNFSYDNNNCGFCGNKCPTDFHCEDGFCVGEIGTVTTTAYCAGADLKKDNNNCGFCGNKCPTGFYCAEGFCVQDLPSSECIPQTVFEDNFTVGVPGGWIFNQSGGRAEFSESRDYLFLSSNGLDNEFPLVGRNNAFDRVGEKYYVEIRFQFPQIRERASGIFIGSLAPFHAYTKMPDNVGAFDRENVLSVKADTRTGILNITAFGDTIYAEPYDTNWHVIKVEYLAGMYRIYFDGSMYAGGTSTTNPKTIWFGNYTYYTSESDWTDLRVDYVRVGTLCRSTCSGDFNSDDLNCGFCGHICPTGFHCSRGFCVNDPEAQTTATTTPTDCRTVIQWGREESSCCDGADNDNDNLVDAQDPTCNVDRTFGSGVSDVCYGTSHPYRTKINTESGYFTCPSGTSKMRFYVKSLLESGDKVFVYDGANGNRLVGLLESNFNGGQYGWTEYYPTWKAKLAFNSDPVAGNYGFDVARIDCYNGHKYNTTYCNSYYCGLKSGTYCNGPYNELRTYFCSEGLCKYSVSATDEINGRCGVHGMTVETDKQFYVPGEQVRVRGTVFDRACPSRASADTFVEVRTSFGRWTTYTDYTGTYTLSMFDVPSGDYEVTARAFESAAGAVTATASKWFAMEPNNLVVTIEATPVTVVAGEKSRISGKVTDRFYVPIRQANVDIRTPWGKSVVSTNSFGEYSTDVWTTTWYGNSNVTARAQKDSLSGWASTILTVNPGGIGSEQFTLEAPAIVKPNTLFSAGGRWFIDGNGASEPFIVSYRDTRKTASPEEGIYNVTLLSPSTESCDLVTARNRSVQVCTRIHDSISLSIDYESPVLSFIGSYEDGTPVNGSLAYAIDSGRYNYQRMEKGLFEETSRTFEPGSHTVYANLNDGRLFASATKAITVPGAPSTTTLPGEPGVTTVPGGESTTTIESALGVSASAPDEIVVYKWEEDTLLVNVKNDGNEERQALVRFGSETGVARVSPGSSAQVSFRVSGTENARVPLEVMSMGKIVLEKDVNVIVKPFTLIFPRVVFYKGEVSVPYIMTGFTENAIVNDSLEDANGTFLVKSSVTSDLPTNGTISSTLPVGEYTACVNATNWRGFVILSDCEKITVKEGLGAATWFIVAIGAAAILLLFF